jgi:hypothetical protein
MTPPSDLADGWWGCFVWAADEHGVIPASEAAPLAGPPPGPPLARIGPSFAGALSGMLAEEDGRQCLRLALPGGSDPARPWQQPLIVRVALKWDAVRAATLTANELSREALVAFGRAVVAAGRPV